MCKPNIYRVHIYWLLLFLMPVQASVAQISISGPTCTVAGKNYSYNASGSFGGSTSMTWCVPTNATILQAYGSNVVYNGNCVTGNGVGSIVVQFNTPGGTISLTSDVGSASPLNITTVPALSPGAITSGKTQTISYNATPAAINCSAATNGACSPSYSYQWMSSTDNVNFSNVSGATSQNLTFSTGLIQTTYYKRRVTEVITNTTLYSDVATITVAPPFSSVTISPASQSIFAGTSPGAISGSTATGGNCGGAYTYQWQSSSDGTNFANITSATGLSYSPGTLTATTWYRRKDACGSDVAFSNIVVINVYQHLASSNITPSTQIVSYNTSSALMGNITPTGGMCGSSYTYQWQQSADGTNFTDVSGATAANYAAPAMPAGTYYFKRKVVCSSETIFSNIVTVTFNPLLVPGTLSPSSMTIPPSTSPGTLVVTPASGGGCGGSYSYQWQQSTDGSTYTDVSGATAQNYTPGTISSTIWFRRKVSCSIDIAYTDPLKVTVSSTNVQSLNYIQTRTLSKPVTDATTAAGLTNAYDVSQSTSYFDGLGRHTQTVDWQASPAGKDMVTIASYDRFNRETAKYLPYTSSAADGAFKPNAFGDQYSFNAGQFPNEQYYYQHIDYDTTPLNMPVASYSPGMNWLGSGRGIATRYWGNTTTDAVRIWTVTDVAGAFGTYATSATYSAGTLNKNVTVDERGIQTIEFKDLDGRLILKKVQLTAAADNGTGSGYTGWLSTYYIYDDYNQLRCVVQPRGVELLVANSWSMSALGGDILNEQCFRYEYDQRDRVIMKKVPGAGEVWMVYDVLDRPVLSQDANLRGQNKWLFTKYDALNRPILTGFYTDATHTSQSSMQSYLNTQNMGLYEIYNPANYPVYSLNQSFPVVSFSDVLTVTYYDDYSWTGWFGPYGAKDNSYDNRFSTAYSSYPYPQPLTQSVQTRGAITGTWDATGPGMFVFSYYDDHGRIIQTRSLNFSGGLDIATMQYDFAGRLLQSYLRHQKGGANPQTHYINTQYNYDPAGRLKSVYKNIDSAGTDQLIDSIQYNELGQVRTKYLGNGIDSLVYDYNIRGWVTEINKSYLTGTANHYFGMELAYDKTTAAIGTTSYVNPAFNGNIAGVIWKSAGDGVGRKYDFTYDNVNRLTAANFLQNTAGSSWDNSYINYSVNNLSYDANGNIQSMKQYGFKLGGSSLIDDLQYNYQPNTNKLSMVADGQNDPNSKLGDFHYTGTKGSTDYTYDANGNLQLDNNKAITSITYNYLNLPLVIQINGKGSIQYWYDAAGNKLQKQVVDATLTPQKVTNTLYIGGIVYQNDTVQFIGHEEGRARWAYHRYINGTTGNKWEYDFFEKDHLGNTRVVLSQQKDTAQYLATLESAYRNTENQLFYNLSGYPRASVSGYPVDYSYTNPNDSVARVNGNGPKVGPGIVLKVMSGDKVDISTQYYYNGTGTNSGNLTANDLLNSLASGIATLTGGAHGSFADLTGGSSPLPGALTSFISSNNTAQSGKPQAFLNWILLDDQFKYVGSYPQSGAIPVGSAGTTGGGTLQAPLAYTGIPITKSGYLYIYVSNATPGWDVFFDNLSVRTYTGPMLEETHYYPFGLTMAGISDKALKGSYAENKRKFNEGTEIQNKEFTEGDGLELYATEHRLYDPQLGRFIQGDAYAEVFSNWSPYTYAIDDPVLLNDPSGLQISDSAHPQNRAPATVTHTKTVPSNPILFADLRPVRKNPYFILGGNQPAYIPYTPGGTWDLAKTKQFRKMMGVAFTLIPIGRGLKLLYNGYKLYQAIKDYEEIPETAEKVARYALDKNGAAMRGWKGGSNYANDGRDGGELLPVTDAEGDPITYKEYDVWPKVPGQNRGAERIVIGSDKSVYYTNDHYKSFTELDL